MRLSRALYRPPSLSPLSLPLSLSLSKSYVMITDMFSQSDCFLDGQCVFCVTIVIVSNRDENKFILILWHASWTEDVKMSLSSFSFGTTIINDYMGDPDADE